MDFEVLIMGSDANAYYMARCCHEAYNKKAHLIGAYYRAFTKYSNILNIEYDSSIWSEEGFLNALKRFRERYKDKKILLVASNETYVEFISKNASKLKKDFYFNVPSLKIISSLITKENFYKTYSDSILDFPSTVYYDCKKGGSIDINFDFPVIVKPSNVISYNHISFEGKNKIYKIENKEDLEKTINIICHSGYNDTLIIQEFIPGDDSYLFDAVVYADKNSKVKLVSFAQIGLQEHAKAMVGNAAILINGKNYYDGNVKEMIDKIIKFMEIIGYKGFCEFDMKYDARCKKFKVLEINARQGRCSYYISACGYNLIKILVDDLIMNENIPFSIIDEEVLLSFVPKTVLKKYVKNEEFKKYALKNWRHHVDPMKYKKDHNLLRKVLLLKMKKRYLKEYKEGYWRQ